MCYGKLQRQITTIAAGLNVMGIGRNSRVALVLPNGPEMASAFLAVASCATCAPLNPSYTTDDFAFYLDDLGVDALIVLAGIDSPARTIAQHLKIQILELRVNDQDPAGSFTIINTAAFDDNGSVEYGRPDDVALVLHTSGTTGRPKQVRLTHANLCASAANVAATLRLTPDDRCINIMPLFHIHGLVAAVLASIAAGSSVACTPGITGGSFFDWLGELRPTWFTAVPTMLQHILDSASEFPAAIQRNPLQFIRSASAPLSPTLMAALERGFNAPVIEAYGMTEAAHQIASNPLPPGLRRPGSVGLAAGPEIAICDEAGTLLPQGARGEIVICGPNVTNSDTDSMVQNGDGSEGWLRTGDLGWLDVDGYLFLTGRLKETINRGGETISPREIDAAIESHPGVQTAIAFGVPHRTLGEEIVAAVIKNDTTPIQESDILDWVRTKMGTTRVPRKIYFVEQLPRTESGKVRRSELARLLGLDQPGIVPSRSISRVQSHTTTSPLAAAITGLWMSELQVTHVGPDDDFFLLGGDSLRGMQLLAKIKVVFGVDLTFEVLLREAATIPGMARAIEEARAREASSGSPSAPLQASIPRRSEGGPAVLSDTQRRMWFLDQLNPGNTSYNESRGYRLLGELDVDTLARSVNYMASRHEILRTSYTLVDAELSQIVHKDQQNELKRFDLVETPCEQQEEATKDLLRDEMRRPFDLECGPIFRAQLLRLGAENHVLLFTVHHIASDGWSVGVFNRELSAAFAAFVKGQEPALPALPIQYADYAVWQREWLQGDALQSQLAYWKDKLAELPPLDLPTDRPRPPVESFRGGHLEVELPASMTTALKALARREGTTLFMTLLAAFQVLLHRYSGQEDFAVGTPIAGRGRTELEGLIGFFVNTLVLRTDLSGNPAFRELLARVRETALGAYSHQDLPFEKLVEGLAPARDLSRNPLFQVMFVMQNTPEGELSLDGIEAIRLPLESNSAKFDLTLSLRETKDGLQANWEYASDLFDATTIERMAGHFRVLLEAIVADPEQRIGHLPLLTETERHQLLVEWNDTATDYPRDKCVHQLFEEQVGRSPDAVALVFEDKQLTYTKLNARANQLAHHLISLGVGPEVLVGICVERSPEMVIGLLAILKAGGAYVPLDPDYPQARLNFMLGDTQAPVLLTQERLLGKLPPYEGRIVCLDRDLEDIDRQNSTNPPCHATAQNLAYVIYTSGSTGKPKGATAQHRGFTNLIHWYAAECSLNTTDTVLLISSISFDLAQKNVFAPLTTGARLHLPAVGPYEPEKISQCIAREKITLINCTPSAFDPLIEHLEGSAAWSELASLRWVLLGGEPISLYKLSPWMYHDSCMAQIVNTYGPTECTDVAIFHRISRTCSNDRAFALTGRPLPNVALLIADNSLQPCPVGLSGELCIAGDGIGGGYLGDAELTAAAFIANPHPELPGVRLYRTGDLVRYLPDGNIEFLGRIDDQVKIRGFRIELAEIETVLAEHPAIRQAVVLAREDTPGDKRLVAYVVSADAAFMECEPLRSFLSERLPEYMRPAAYVMLERLPLTPNGKLDRKALPVPVQTRLAMAGHYVASRNPLEAMISDVWCEVLKLDQVGVHDNFFELGGHSLLAAQVISRLTKLLKVDLPLRRFFDSPTIATLAAETQRKLTARENREIAPIVLTLREGDLPLSFAQQRLWFLDQVLPNKAAYNIPMAWQLQGKLDLPALQTSLTALVARHETLRTRFALSEDEPVQVIDSPYAVALPLSDLSALEQGEREAQVRQHIDAEAAEPFDLERGPVFRLRLLRLDAENHVLLLTVHHIASDGWSVSVFDRELSAAYSAFVKGSKPELPALPIQYADYAAWQREWLQCEALESQLAYWKDKLADLTVLELPTDRPRPPVKSFRGGHLEVELPASMTTALKALARREGTTLFMTLLAAFQVLLHRYSGQEDFAVGTPIAGRGRTELEGLIGFFVNTLVLRTDLSGNPAFRELLARVRETALGAYSHQDLPFEKLVEELAPVRDLSRNPLFQVMFVLQNTPGEELSLQGLEVSHLPLENESAKFDLTLSLRETKEGLQASWRYAGDLFDATTIERMARHFRVLLEAIVADPEQRIGHLPLLTEAERHQLLVEWNDTAADYPRDKCVHQLFEEQVGRSPDAVALVFEDKQFTYRQLNERANQLAHHLISLGVGPEVLVGICVERSPEMVIGLLAILKAGGAYVPLDPDYPQARLNFMLGDTQAPVLLTQERLLGKLPPYEGRIVCLDRDLEDIDRQNSTNPPCDATAQNLAYVIYTSGSTGRPKGILLPQATLANLMAWHDQSAPGGRVAQFTSISFDVSLQETLYALLSGKTLIVIDGNTRLQPEKLVSFIQDNTITDLFVPNIVLEHLATAAIEARCYLSALANIYQAGEALTITPAVQAFFVKHPACRLHNHYGPAETHVVTTQSLPENLQFWPYRPSIGSPIPNTRTYILGNHGELVPIGVTGELYIAGVGLARGYLNQPELTAEKFVPDPFSGVPGARMYRTGDLVRYLPDGNIEFLGRIDDQVKIRGFRIELGEIEAVLAEHPAIRQAVVLAREDTPGDKRLVAYVVSADTAFTDCEPLRSFLSERLPEYMRPAAYVMLERLPLTPNGKLDRKALPVPVQTRLAMAGNYVASRNPLEAMISDVWCEVLKLDQVSVQANFFELGGHSLLAAQMLARLTRLLKFELPLRGFFDSPTVAGLAADAQKKLTSGEVKEISPIVPALRDGAPPLSFAQQLLWLLDQVLPDKAPYNMPTAWHLQGKLDLPALQASLNALVVRHETLRTRFALREDELVQIIDPPYDVALPLTDLSTLEQSERKAQVRQRIDAEARDPFELDHGPIFRAQLLRLGAEDHALLLTVHHIASDGWSVGVFDREFSAAYAAFVKGQEPQFPTLPIQYADFAIWQRGWLQGEVLESQLAYWKDTLADQTVLELPTDRPRPPVQSFRGRQLEVELPVPLTTALKMLARHEGATLFMALLAAFQVLLHRYSGQDDFAVGTPIAGRGHTELEGLIGFFANTLVLRTDLSGNPAFRELLARVRETALGAYTHQDLPFEKLVEELAPARDLSRNPLFQVMFVLQNAPGEELSLQGLEVSHLPLEGRSAKFDLTLSLRETKDGLQASWEYASDLFDATTIERMAGHFRMLLEAVVADPEQRIGHLHLLTETERHQLLVEWNDTAADYPRDKCVHQLFEEQVQRTPDALAIVFEDRQLTYTELNARANQLAHHLISLGVGPEVLVGICVERSLEMVIGLLAILKAGGAYVPLDPDYPQTRLEFMLEDTQAPVLLTQQSLLRQLPSHEGHIVCMDRDLEEIARYNNTNPPCHATSQNLAYVIFTSGSTGRPKGAMNEHRSVCNRLLWMQEEYGLEGTDRVLQKTPFSFDVSVWEFFWPLLTGVRLVIARPDGHRDNEYLLSLIRDREITTLHFVPSMLRVFLEEDAVKSCPALRRVICSGEALDHDLQERFFLLLPEVELHNLYGPTETAVDVTYWRCRAGNFHPTVPIGRPLANTKTYILDTRMNPVPVGVRGELHIGGVQVGRGYIGQPELTAERFVPDPFSGVSGSRLYKTGDLARYLPNGNIEFLGRIDDQVKIRGFRIELGEIESVLAEHPAIRQAAVVAREDAPGDKRLVAYVVTDVAGPFGEQAMRNWLGARLPQYMIPSHFVTLPVLPTTPNGKLVRNALPKPLLSLPREEGTFTPPRDDLERQVARAFEKVLGVTPVGASGNFFDLGGHSLLILTLLVEIEKTTGARLPVRTVFDFPTVAQLASLARAPEMLAGLQPLVPLKPGGTKPPFFMTHSGVGADFFYNELLPHLPKDRPFYAIQPPGFDGKRPPCRSFEELADCLIDEILAVQPQGPYALGGVCLGGIIAWETARQLQARGHVVSSLLLFDAWAPKIEEPAGPASPSSNEKQRGLALVRMKIDYHRNALALLALPEWPRYLWGLGERIARKVRLLPAAAPVSRPHSQAMHDANHAIAMSRKRYVPGTFSGQVDYFRAENQSVVGVRPDLAWTELTQGKLHVHVVPGWHSNMLREPFVRALAPILQACLNRREIDASTQQTCSWNAEAQSGEATLEKSPLSPENT